MKITRKSMFTGKVRTKDLPVTEKQIKQWESGNYHVQEVFKNLSPDDREFILTGVTPEEWENAFS